MPSPANRLLFVDNIRWTMIILVLSMHASDTYSPFGNWYYAEHPHVSFATALTFGIYQSFLQAFFMGLLFFIAGCFAATSLRRKGPSKFARERLVRLGLSTLLYMLAIGPLTQYFLSHTWGTGGFFFQWKLHIEDGQILSETGPMWFAAVLLCFCLLYAVAASAKPTTTPSDPGLPAPHTVIGLIAAMTVASFLLRIPLPETVSILNVHPGDFPQYILMFAAGIVAGRRGWLEAAPIRLGAAWALALLTASFGFFPALLYFGGALEGDTTRYPGGANLVSLFKCLWESMVCVGMTFGLYALFKRYFARQGEVTRFLADNAFAVYLVHPPIIIALALGMRGLNAPALVKAALLTLAAAVATYAFSAIILRRLPALGRIL
jgi:glucans biosynthesis protein C